MGYRLRLATSDSFVYNMSIPGDNSEYLLKRFQSEAITREPDIIIFSIGINDSALIKEENTNIVGVKEYHDNILELIIQSRKLNSSIVFLGLSKVDESKTKPVPWGDNIYYMNESILKYNEILKNTAEENGISFIKMLDYLGDEDFEDGLHPNSKGHEKIFTRVKDFLSKNNLLI